MLKMYMLVYVCQRDIVRSCVGTHGCMKDKMCRELVAAMHNYLEDDELLRIANALSKDNWDMDEIHKLPYFNEMWSIGGDSAWCNFGHDRDWAILEV